MPLTQFLFLLARLTVVAYRTREALPVFVSMLLAVAVVPTSVHGGPSEQSLLYDFYNSTSGWESYCSGGWSSNATPVCTGGNSSNWARVTCSGGIVTEIDLSSCHIRGALLPQWSNLTTIQVVYLQSNSLSGTLPAQWSSMTSMRTLSLNSNFLSGTLPPQWSSLANIQYLSLYGNSFTDALPPQWSHMTAVIKVQLSGNSLSGTLPPQWGSMTSLQYLSLYSNSLNGTLPPQWGSVTTLQVLFLDSSSFSGTLPPQWGSLKSLQTLSLFLNSLSGPLPSQWSSMTNMKDLALYNNSLSGNLPSEWSSMQNMQTLALSSNSLRGTLPAQWSNMTIMQTFSIAHNSLGGSLPPQWCNMTVMQYLSLTSNSLGGTLPPVWSIMNSLWGARLDDNSLVGTIPPQWDSLTSLVILHLEGNKLNGSLPQWGSMMRGMQTLSLSRNTLSGTLPPQWGTSQNLQYLSIYGNAIRGTLPPQWCGMGNIQTLFLQGNSLIGTLPPEWRNLTNMQSLDLSRNSLSGTLPQQWSNMSSWMSCRVNDNCLIVLNVVGWWGESGRVTSGQRSFCPDPNKAGNTSHNDAVTSSTSMSKSSMRNISHRRARHPTRTESTTGRCTMSMLDQYPRSKSETNRTARGEWHAQRSLSEGSSPSLTPIRTAKLDPRRPVLLHVEASSPVATARMAAVALAFAPMLGGAYANFGSSAVQLSVASSLLSARRNERGKIDGIGTSLFENPLQLGLPSLSVSLQMTGGAVIGNAIICLAVVVCVALTLHAFKLAWRKCGVTSVWLALREYFSEHLPGALLPPLGLLLQPTVAASLSLMISPHRSTGSCAGCCWHVGVCRGAHLDHRRNPSWTSPRACVMHINDFARMPACGPSVPLGPAHLVTS